MKDEDGLEHEFDFSISLITDLAALLLECQVNGNVPLGLIQNNADDCTIRIISTSKEKACMNKTLADLSKDPLAHDLYEMVPEEEMQAFKDRLSDVLQKVSDEVICSMNTALPVIEMELSLKYKKKVRAKKTITDNDMVFQYGEKQLARLSERNVRVIGIMDKPGYEGMLRGRFSTPLYAMKKDDYIFVQNGDEKIKTDRYKCKKQLYILDELMRNYKNAGFVVRIPEEWKEIVGNKRHRDEMAKKFKDNDSPLKIAIVVDMWLTGFDVPSLATMYVYKPMKGYNLMQAIARVNRVFQDKEGGLVVDYVGIAGALKEAMNDYTVRDKKNYGDTDIDKVALPKFQEKLSICRDIFHDYDYSKFITGTDLDRSKAISGGVNFIVAVDKEDDKDTFLKEALMLKQALSLCSSLADESSRIEAAFFESVRVLVMRLMNQGQGEKISLPEMNQRINELLKASIKSDGVINLFSDVSQEFSLFDTKFLEEIAKMKEKNLAVELLKKLISEQVQVYKRTNVVKSQKFSEIIQAAMNRYLNGMLTNEQVIEELLNLAKQIAAAHQEGQALGLTADELAFYDALTKPQAIKDFYENEELIAITKELADTLRKNRTIDWQKRESARAKMRMMIKKLLKKHKYPPEGMEDAVQTVMTQCELWTDNNDMESNIIELKMENKFAETQNEHKMVAEDKWKYEE